MAKEIGKKSYRDYREINQFEHDETTDAKRIIITSENGDNIGVQNPLSTDGDSIYAKDIDTTKSSIGTFSSSITDLFDDYSTSITDSSSTSPKTFSIYLKRPIESSEVGLGSLTGNFSNVKIYLKDMAGTVRNTIDDSSNNTKYTSNVYSFEPTVFIEIVVEFYTTDPVTITGMYVPKMVHITAQLKALKPDGTETYIDATAGGNLKVSVEEADGEFNPVRSDLEGGGYVTVGTTAVELTFAGQTNTIVLTSKITNTGTIWIGKSNVDSTGANALISIEPGETVFLRYDDSNNALYAVSDVAGQSLLKGALL